MAPLRIAITTSDEPIVVNGFVRAIIDARHAQIVCLGVIERAGSYARGMRARRKAGSGGPPGAAAAGAQQARAPVRAPASVVARLLEGIQGMLSVLLIYGVRSTLIQASRLVGFRVAKALHRLGLYSRSPSIEAAAERFGIPVLRAQSVNDPEFCRTLRGFRPDVIINQAPGILRADFLTIPRVGVLNRHNSLLPRNRGRLSTFWAIYRGERQAGVSVHFVTEALDAGEIIAQREVPIGCRESVSSLAGRCYALAPDVMLEALDRLERGETGFRPNSDAQATYNSNPTLLEAMRFRRMRMVSALRAFRAWLLT